MDLDHLIERLYTEWKTNQLAYYLPYGHPATLTDGVVWKAKHRIPSRFHFLVDVAYHHNSDEIWELLEGVGGTEGCWTEWTNKPWQLDFHNASIDHQERMLMAANRPGKTRTAAYDTAYHLTGLYPDWWEGRRFDQPILVWTGSPTNETSRDIVQKELLGGLDSTRLGTGAVPKELLHGRPKTRQAGVSDVVDTFRVRHVSGGLSQVVLKTYEQGWRKWQGTAPHVVWLDEEPEDSEERQRRIYSESLTRLLTSRGLMAVTFTPLLGQTDLVRHFQAGGDGVFMETATWDDAPHLNTDERSRLAASYPEHERDARTRGVPMMGEGRVFTTDEADIKIAPIEIPAHWARIKGIDFGLDHPAAVADIAWDRDQDIIYVTRVWKKRNLADVTEHCEAIRHSTPWIPVAWPHDGTNRGKGGDGKRLKDIYAEKGLKMLNRSACYSSERLGGQPKEPIVMEINDRAMSGRFKVFSTCTEFFDEYRNYHRKNGKLNDRFDDILKAVFYAVMMKRAAATPPMATRRRQMVPASVSMRR